MLTGALTPVEEEGDDPSVGVPELPPLLPAPLDGEDGLLGSVGEGTVVFEPEPGTASPPRLTGEVAARAL